MLNDTEKRGILALALMAAFSDGSKSDGERESIQSVAEGIGAIGGVSMTSVLTDVMLRRIDLQGAVGLLTSPESRILAYEVAVQVCDSDGLRSEAETAYLNQLSQALHLTPAQAQAALEPADTLAAAPPDRGEEIPSAEMLPVAVNAPSSGTQGATGSKAGANPDVDSMIRNYAILCGALELLPQSLAGMAVIPMQVKMVYRIGKAHGEELGTAHIKDFIATVGVGLTSQYLEGFARKLLGGLLKQFGGKWAGKLGKGGASVAMSFATTYALGCVANQYYAGGRRMTKETLQSAYSSALGQAQQLESVYRPAMEKQAAGLDLSKIMAMVKGGDPVPR